MANIVNETNHLEEELLSKQKKVKNWFKLCIPINLMIFLLNPKLGIALVIPVLFISFIIN